MFRMVIYINIYIHTYNLCLFVGVSILFYRELHVVLYNFGKKRNERKINGQHSAEYFASFIYCQNKAEDIIQFI